MGQEPDKAGLKMPSAPPLPEVGNVVTYPLANGGRQSAVVAGHYTTKAKVVWTSSE